MPCLMGQRRDPNQPRKPMKRSPIRRKKPKACPKNGRKGVSRIETGGHVGDDKAKAYRAFMGSGQGLSSIMSGKTHSSLLLDDEGRPLPTERHHILPQSTHPEYRLCAWNTVILTREEHTWAEEHGGKEGLFMKALWQINPEQAKVVEEHRHHRKG